MAHILPYRTRSTLKHSPLPGDISQFLRHSLRRDSLPPLPIILGCPLIVGLVLGIKFNNSDQHVINAKGRLISHESLLGRSSIFLS